MARKKIPQKLIQDAIEGSMGNKSIVVKNVQKLMNERGLAEGKPVAHFSITKRIDNCPKLTRALAIESENTAAELEAGLLKTAMGYEYTDDKGKKKTKEPDTAVAMKLLQTKYKDVSGMAEEKGASVVVHNNTQNLLLDPTQMTSQELITKERQLQDAMKPKMIEAVEVVEKPAKKPAKKVLKTPLDKKVNVADTRDVEK